MPKYQTWIDPRADEKRKELRTLNPQEICSGTMKLALHLSDMEEVFLITRNRETLGLPPGADRDIAWGQFIKHPDSAPYRVNKV